MLPILFKDDHFVIINKPYGWITHASKIARDATQIVLQQVRDQVGQKVYPIHRLDRKTTGLLILGLDPLAHKKLSEYFQKGKIQKYYVAITRGYLSKEGIIDYPLKNEKGKEQLALTRYKTLDYKELPWPSGKHNTSRYSLVGLSPKTGRMHQLRRHLSHEFHPIIGDRPHGCNKQNRLFKQQFGFEEMLLHAYALSFEHPFTKERVLLRAPFSLEFQRMAKMMGFNIHESWLDKKILMDSKDHHKTS